MKLSRWAKKNGISYWTAFRWFKDGTLPVSAIQTKSRTILVQEPDGVVGKVAIYGRVSSSDQKDDLNRQIARLAAYATTQKLPVSMTVAEIGSGLNGKRRKLLRLLADRQVTMCARLYGKRSAKARAKRAIEAADAGA